MHTDARVLAPVPPRALRPAAGEPCRETAIRQDSCPAGAPSCVVLAVVTWDQLLFSGLGNVSSMLAAACRWCMLVG